MKAHQMARLLLNGPDVDVVGVFDNVPDYATALVYDKIERRGRIDSQGKIVEEVEVVTLGYTRHSEVYESLS